MELRQIRAILAERLYEMKIRVVPPRTRRAMALMVEGEGNPPQQRRPPLSPGTPRRWALKMEMPQVRQFQTRKTTAPRSLPRMCGHVSGKS